MPDEPTYVTEITLTHLADCWVAFSAQQPGVCTSSCQTPQAALAQFIERERAFFLRATPETNTRILQH